MNISPATIQPFNPAEDWPEPDMTFGEPVVPPAPKLTPEDMRAIFGPWASWIESAAEVKSAPSDYVCVSLLCAASAAIGNSRWAVPWDGWKEPPILWAMMVGNPSDGKSPAFDAVLDPIKEIETETAETYKAKRSEWERDSEIAKLAHSKWKADAKAALAEGEDTPAKPDAAVMPPEPIRERIRISDSTTESVAHLLSRTWRGLLMARDELSGWLAGMDRYSNGGDRPFWLEAYGGRTYTVDRKGNPEPIIVDHLSVSVIGGTQPDKVQSLLVNCDDDGLVSRFLTVFPEPVPLKMPDTKLDEQALADALRALRSLSPAIGEDGQKRPFYIELSNEAARALQEFRVDCRGYEGEATGLFKSHIGKMPGMVVRIANVLAHLDWAANPSDPFPTSITANHIGRACHYVGEYLRKHAYRTYGPAKLPAEMAGAKSVAQIIKSEGITNFKARDIQNRNRSGLSRTQDVKAALSVLIEADWLREDRVITGGRPSVTYIVNPLLGDVS